MKKKFNSISVIVPNYNYKKYLKDRLDTILWQKYPIQEIIILDDCSTDGSMEFIKDYIKNIHIPIRIIENKKNSSNVFSQWMRGISMCNSEYIWIAEADDLSSPYFLTRVMKAFQKDSEVVLSYSMSAPIDEYGNLISRNYLKATLDIDKNKFLKEYISNGLDEIRDILSIKNHIPNVSSVVFKKFNIQHLKKEILQYKVAGDWFFYISILEFGKIAYAPDVLNFWRRHSKSVSAKKQNNFQHYYEVVKIQDHINSKYSINKFTRMKAIEYRNKLRNWLLIYRDDIKKYRFFLIEKQLSQSISNYSRNSIGISSMNIVDIYKEHLKEKSNDYKTDTSAFSTTYIKIQNYLSKKSGSIKDGTYTETIYLCNKNYLNYKDILGFIMNFFPNSEVYVVGNELSDIYRNKYIYKTNKERIFLNYELMQKCTDPSLLHT